MKNTFIVVSLFAVTILFTSFNAGFEPNEIIRMRIENQKITQLRVDGELIYCAASITEIYRNRIFDLAWKNKNSVEQLISRIEASESEGLNPQDYHLNALLELYNSYPNLNPEQQVDLDLLATDSFLLLTSHLLSGKVNPKSIDSEWYVKRREGNPTILFEQAMQNNNVSQLIDESLPKQKVYLGLKQALAKYEKIKTEGDWVEIPEGETLKKGMVDDRIVLVKKRLSKSLDLNEGDFGDMRLYDDKLFDAVLTFQRRHNLEPDGSIGNLTISAMNVSIDERIDQIKVNMERWRWLPQEFGNYYVIVNIANYSVEVFKDGKSINQFKAIVGKNYRKTPVFSSKITYLVLNPTWTIPPGILNADVLPAVKKDINYLKKKNLTVYDDKGNVIDPAAVNWSSPIVKTYMYRQPAGPDNALGAVKFMFPNEFSVYLHDTPAKDLFEKTERSFSSGCIRVHNPLLIIAKTKCPTF